MAACDPLYAETIRGIEPVAITIRNKITEELIRRIGRRTGEEPSAVIDRLVSQETAPYTDRNVPEEEVRRRMQRFEELRKRFPPPANPPTWAEIEAEMDSIFGDDLK
jgi:hypothetical protein